MVRVMDMVIVMVRVMAMARAKVTGHTDGSSPCVRADHDFIDGIEHQLPKPAVKCRALGLY